VIDGACPHHDTSIKENIMNSETHAPARPVARARFAAMLTPRRAALLNLLLAALLILLADTPAITAAIGGGALFFAAVTACGPRPG